MENRKLFGIFIILSGLALLIAIVYFIFFYDFAAPAAIEERAVPPQQQALTEKVATTTPEEKNVVRLDEPIKQEKKIKKEIGADDLKRMAMSFAERFGSYSNQSNYENISDLKIFMTEKMAAWADSYVASLVAARGKTDIYYGVTTTAVAGEVKSYNAEAGTAEIIVKTQRREAAFSTGNSTNKYQDILIRFSRENNMWKMDAALWQ